MTLAAQNLPITWDSCPVLIIGWGRIGKCLAQLLQKAGAEVSVAARKSTDRAMLTALGLTAEDPARLNHILCRYRAIINTAPEPILYGSQLRHCRDDCLLMELASRPGILSENVLKAPGLPNKMAPESSGRLIARTILRLCAEQEVGT
jgi:dipicolinate synthase subunit A